MPAGTVTTYPFTAVVGMDDAKRMMECALVNPNIRTVLLRGGSGTAKTVLARAAAGITEKKVVNCPLNVTDEQLFGGLDVEAALKTGQPRLEPGLLSRADGGILYVDDVNLMDGRLLASIMDAVLSGTVHVERGPISASYQCRTTLVATMNPCDSDLSAHMLDRFDLCAQVPAADDGNRRTVLSRNSDYARDPASFAARYACEESEEKEKVRRAAEILPLVKISDELVSVVSELCVRVGADGYRGDIAMVECSESLAALNGRDEVVKKDIEEAAVLCLPHRRDYSQPPPPPREPPEPPREPPEDNGDGNEENDDDPDDGEKDAPEDRPEQDGPERSTEMPDLEEQLFEIGREFRVIDYLSSRDRMPSRTKTRKGRRSMAVSADGTGRYARARIPEGRTSDIAFDATMRAAAPYQKVRHSDNVAVVIEPRDIREKVRERRSGCTLLFLVDASGSLGVRRRMTTVKGAILSMLKDSYVRRDRIGLMAFRRDSAEMILPPTKSVEYSYRCLEDLPTGGRTPLPEALNRAEEFMTSYSRCHVGERCFIIVVTDGRANVPLREGADANEEVLEMAEDIRIPGIRWIVVDTGIGFPHFDNAEKLAEKLEARYFRLEELDADGLAESIRASAGI